MQESVTKSNRLRYSGSRRWKTIERKCIRRMQKRWVGLLLLLLLKWWLTYVSKKEDEWKRLERRTFKLAECRTVIRWPIVSSAPDEPRLAAGSAAAAATAVGEPSGLPLATAFALVILSNAETHTSIIRFPYVVVVSSIVVHCLRPAKTRTGIKVDSIPSHEIFNFQKHIQQQGVHYYFRRRHPCTSAI